MNRMLQNTSPETHADEVVTLEMDGSLAIIRINNPPVNAGSMAVRAGLINALQKARQSSASGAVLIGEGRSFIAGSDLREFGLPLTSPQLPDVICAVEQSPFPVVAAMHGVALGGGLELALGCDYRLATGTTKVGLPEVSLGMVPGAGGTQRLPRLVGLSRAITMICGSQRIGAADAQSMGLIDQLVEGNLLEASLQFLNAAHRPKRLTIELSVAAEDEESLETTKQVARKRGRHRQNVLEAIRLVECSATQPAASALTDERETFQSLRVSADAFALRYLFFAEKKAGVVEGVDKSQALPISTVAVIGGGTMGQGITKSLLAAGYKVRLIERDNDAADAAVLAIAKSYRSLVKKGRMTADDASERQSHLQSDVGLETLGNCDLVIEAVFEDMSVKQLLLKDLEDVVSDKTILATNTSYLDINEMVSGLRRPASVIGLHFFSPADLMKLLEIVKTDSTSVSTLATGLTLARKLGKQAVVSEVAEGFIGNRLYAAYRRRAELLVLDGALPEQVDAAVRDFGFAMGPFEVSDMSGLDIAWAMRKRTAASRDPAARYVSIPDRLCEAGRLGRKTGKGWYDYSDGVSKPDPWVNALIEEVRTDNQIEAQNYNTEYIQRQLLATIINEAACVLDDGVAQRASDIDVTFANGYGFPRVRGGPLYWATEQDFAQLTKDLNTLETAIGHGYRAGKVKQMLESMKLSAGN
ncbi:MAG: 3-hydroxyacyl-CoA dehydrogenase NAD-binding domain-containing protein [Granulosicoccus sp.]